MKIIKQHQYNQGVGKYKLLSSTAGVGSILTSKLGSYVLISDINKWNFIKWANAKIEGIRSNNSDDKKVYALSKLEIMNRGLQFVDDQRFINFIKKEREIENLVCFVEVPHMALDEKFNTPKWKSHPIKAALQKSGEEHKGAAKNYMVSATHFPKWFRNSDGDLKLISEWGELWEKECKKFPSTLRLDNFAPPRDASKFVREINVKNEDGNTITMREYKVLDQTNLVLICPNGHLSDIPWANYLRWKTEKALHQRPPSDKGEELLSTQMGRPCCGSPKLKWTESKTKSEGYASVHIECLNCKLGSGINNEKPKINLEGINSLEPTCIGQKPWEIDIAEVRGIPVESCYVREIPQNGHEKMKVALVTANNVYYATGFSSLFIPLHLADDKSKEIIEAMDVLGRKYNKYLERLEISRVQYWAQKFDINDFIIDNDLQVDNIDEFKAQLEAAFLEQPKDDESVDEYEKYRWQEFRCFSQNTFIPASNDVGISFADIELPLPLQNYFKKVQQVEELRVTNVQLDFARVKPKERIVVDGIVQESVRGKNVFSTNPKAVFVLPANETIGEGLFFEFSEEYLQKWMTDHEEVLQTRFSKHINQRPMADAQGLSSKMKVYNNRYKQFLIHSFSHLMMRELEFSCGYPTASLKERLFISESPERKMAGVLIYTAEGSEGSMGGLVSQGEPKRILEIIKKGLERSINCSSDPLCWESEGQGIFDLNLSACFSCGLVAETACEEMNLALDRRVLVDEQFGYFKHLLAE
ncbi:DUF1998 domain-containing protein [Dyadobacter sp. CY261]|uniref:DUF1998 domain-containing protein n=1 Tax=Dyadobacter sp. CY261 TaxID=2907203 RepID=UPI001F4919CA|nr:DUF1998 domain-containing protein [Dyadobacter sp. CY261]MCF0075331.1 DUF1998 domain-containing protein [Dyadobacter sp. CY261]